MTSMEQIQILSRRARAAGMTYGQYVAQNPSIMPRPVDMSEYRVCKTCGEAFLPPLLKDGSRSERTVNCAKCVEKAREKRGCAKPKEYELICQACGKTMIAPTPRKKFCKECLRERQRECVRRATKERKAQSGGRGTIPQSRRSRASSLYTKEPYKSQGGKVK